MTTDAILDEIEELLNQSHGDERAHYSTLCGNPHPLYNSARLEVKTQKEEG